MIFTNNHKPLNGFFHTMKIIQISNKKKKNKTKQKGKRKINIKHLETKINKKKLTQKEKKLKKKIPRSVAKGWNVAGSVAGDREMKRRNLASPASESSRLGAEATPASWSIVIAFESSWRWIVAKDESAMASWDYGGDGRRSVAGKLKRRRC